MKPYGSPTIPWVHQLLSILCPKLLEDRPTTIGPNQENNPLAMGQPLRVSVLEAQKPDVFKPHPNSTGLQ